MQDHLSQTFAALADPTRRAMLAQLSKGEANVSESGQAVSEKHEPAGDHEAREGFGESRAHHQVAGCSVASLQTQRPAFKGVTIGSSSTATFWEESFDRLEAYLKTVTSKCQEKA